MSWIEKLYQTYENNIVRVGDRKDCKKDYSLLPLFHTTKKERTLKSSWTNKEDLNVHLLFQKMTLKQFCRRPKPLWGEPAVRLLILCRISFNM